MSSSLRVLMTADSVGGVFSYAMDLARGLAALGTEVHLAVMGGRLDHEQREIASSIDGLHVEESDFALEWMRDPWDDVDKAGRWLRAIAERLKPDLVHLNQYAHARLAWPCPVLVFAHSCVASWFEAVRGTPPWGFERYVREVRAGLHAADLVAAPTQFMADALERHYGVANARVVSNGIWLSEHPAEAKEPFVLAAGRLWDEAKNVSQLAAIAGDLPWPVKLAGAEALGPSKVAGSPNVDALGRLSRSELAWTMARAGVFVHVARYEPFGLAPLEAAAAGCALVVSDIEPLRSIWGDAAVRVPLDAPGSLRDAIDTLCRRDDWRAEMAERARTRARRYRAAAMAARTQQLYRELLSGAAREAE